MIAKIMTNVYGSIAVSIFIGVGLASLFHITCKYKDCIEFIAPERDQMRDNVFRWENKCYRVQPRFVSCGADHSAIIHETSETAVSARLKNDF
jgi:hypothetical protein